MKSIGIVGGTGKMGSFFAELFVRHGFLVHVWGRGSTQSLADFCTLVDIVMVSLPIDITDAYIAEIGKYLQPHQCITDVTSLKKSPMEAMKKTGHRYFGMHPMFAPPLSGTMEGQNVVFCSGNAPEEEALFRNVFLQEGASLLSLRPDEHDDLMSVVQGLSHFLDITFIQTLNAKNIDLETVFSARSPAYALKMMLACRTLAQDAHLYGNIQIQNPNNEHTLLLFFEKAHQLFQTIQRKNLQEFSDIFAHQKQYLGNFATVSQEESDVVIDFLAHRVLKKQSPNSFCSTENSAAHIGILGPQNTFSHIAAQEFFPDAVGFKMYPTISSVFTAFAHGEISEIFVPLENILHGTVAESIDGIAKTDLPIRAIYEMKIAPALFTSQGTSVAHISEIFSHPQALAQCSEYLEAHFPKVHITAVASTALAMEKMLTTPRSAAIAPMQQQTLANVQLLAKDIANHGHNATRFAYLSRTPYLPEAKEYQGGFIFSFSSDTPGSLESVLHLFSQNKINLTKIESRPTGNAFGEYIFLVTYEGKIAHLDRFIESLSHYTAFARFLGEFGIFR